MTLSIEQYVDTKEFENDDVEEKDEKYIYYNTEIKINLKITTE